MFWGRYLLVLVGACFILVARQPERFFQPHLLLEDGKIFFADAFNLTPLDALLTRYAGYYHLMPRLIAEAGMGLPLHCVPLFYASTTLLLTAVAASWFYLPTFRALVRSDWLRLAFVLAVLLSPNLEAILILAYVQWPLALWALLVTLTPWPQNRPLAWGVSLGYLLVVGTAPVLIILLPIWLVRLSVATTRWRRFYAAAMLAAHFISLTLLLVAVQQPQLGTTDWQMGLLDLLRGFVYKVISFTLLGADVTEQIAARFGWLALYALAVGVAVALVIPLRSLSDPHKARVSLLLLYVIFASCALYLLRADDFHYTFVNLSGTVLRNSARYFFLGSVAFYLLLLLHLDGWIRSRRQTWQKSLLVTLYLCPLLLYLPSFRQPAWGDGNWPRYARLLTNLQATQAIHQVEPLTPARLTGPTATNQVFLPLVATYQPGWPLHTLALEIPIVPADWFMTVAVSDRANVIYRFPEGITLLGLEEQIRDGALQVDLFWVGKTLVTVDGDAHYTAYVHLVDQARNRLTGSDMLLPAQQGAKLSIFQSQHSMALPPNLSTGLYSLVIGLYHFEDGELVNGHAVLLEHVIEFQ